LGYVGDTGWPADLAGGLCINLTDEAFLVAPAIFIVPLAVVAVHLHRILVTVVVGFAALPVGVMNGTVVRNPGPDIFVDDIIKSNPVPAVTFVSPVVLEEVIQPFTLGLIPDGRQPGVLRSAEDVGLPPFPLLGPQLVAVAPQTPVVTGRARDAEHLRHCHQEQAH